MDGEWVCDTCHSINRPRTSPCYSCGQSRMEAEAASVEIPASDQSNLLSLGGAVTMVCPVCGTARVGWSSRCRTCGLSFDAIALAQVAQAASSGPKSLAQLLLRRLTVLIPGLLLLVLLLVVATLAQSK